MLYERVCTQILFISQYLEISQIVIPQILMNNKKRNIYFLYLMQHLNNESIFQFDLSLDIFKKKPSTTVTLPFIRQK